MKVRKAGQSGPGKEQGSPNGNPVFRCEVLLVLILIAAILASQLIGTATVTDGTQAVDENGLPATSTTLEDLEAPGTRFGVLLMPEWEDAVRGRFPQGELRHHQSSANLFTALDAGEVDAALGLFDERETLTGEFLEIINGFCAAYGYLPEYALCQGCLQPRVLHGRGYHL